MARGTRLQAGGSDCFVIPFTVTAKTEIVDITTNGNTFVKLTIPMDGTNTTTYWTAPWPCRVVEVYGELTSSVSGDGYKLALRKGLSTVQPSTNVVLTTDDIIRNAYSATAVSHVVVVASAANTISRVRYTGELQDTAVSPTLTGVVSTELASGFFDANANFVAGDRLYALYKLNANEDLFSHLKVYVTVAKTEAS